MMIIRTRDVHKTSQAETETRQNGPRPRRTVPRPRRDRDKTLVRLETVSDRDVEIETTSLIPDAYMRGMWHSLREWSHCHRPAYYGI